ARSVIAGLPAPSANLAHAVRRCAVIVPARRYFSEAEHCPTELSAHYVGSSYVPVPPFRLMAEYLAEPRPLWSVSPPALRRSLGHRTLPTCASGCNRWIARRTRLLSVIPAVIEALEAHRTLPRQDSTSNMIPTRNTAPMSRAVSSLIARPRRLPPAMFG